MSKILVAEDERGTRLIVKQLLEKEGHEVIEAADGNTAYDIAKSEAPDVGVLDIRMPGMDGFEVLRKLRSHQVTEKMPVIMLTGVPVEKGEATAASFGASHYLPKPLDPRPLTMAVRSALRESETQDNRGVENGPSFSVMDEHVGRRDSLTSVLRRSDTASSGSAIGVGDPMLDQKLGGGIPPGSLSLIEGQSSAGKSVLCQHLAYSSLRKGHSVAYMTFEDTTQGLISKMESLALAGC